VWFSEVVLVMELAGGTGWSEVPPMATVVIAARDKSLLPAAPPPPLVPASFLLFL
jgi:hypothetical protein